MSMYLCVCVGREGGEVGPVIFLFQASKKQGGPGGKMVISSQEGGWLGWQNGQLTGRGKRVVGWQFE
jgi:hypothetical protein